MNKVFKGVIPASLIPFNADLAIDEGNYRRHLRDLADTEGVTAIAVNGHAAEVGSLSFDEQLTSLRIAVDEVGGDVDVICGVAQGATREALAVTDFANELGADGLLVFPPPVFAFGHAARPEIAHTYYAAIAARTPLPLVLYVDPASANTTLTTSAIVELVRRVPTITGIKDFTNDILVYEDNYRALRSLDREVSVLSSFSRSLLASLSIGGDGILSGHGSLIADLHVELLARVQAGDLAAARRTADVIRPLTQVFYAPPFLDMHNRMKLALALLGRIDEAHVRPPQLPITPGERDQIAAAIDAAGLRRGPVKHRQTPANA